MPETTATPTARRASPDTRAVQAGQGQLHSAGEKGTLTTLQLLRLLDSGPRGLTDTQAEERLVRHGENTPPAWRPASWPRRFVGSLRDPFTTVLLCLGLVSAAVASWGTAA